MKPIQTGDVVGDYKVIDIAGYGGMGAVYKIEHVITKRIEAMKLLPEGSSSDPEQARRFEREIQVQARLHHPNIVALYNAVRVGDSIGLVMEFVEGESLQRMLENGPLSVENAVDITSQVLRALAYSHDAGVIHRDVSPANIIITPRLVAKLTDFGLARGETDIRLSTSGAPLGSPWYMSPEQVKGNGALDARTDLYAMGAVLHEMLTGRKLFEAEGAFAVMQAHVEAEPPPPSSWNPKVPAALDDIVRKAVAKDPAMRFRSADEFRLALQDAAVGAGWMPVTSSPRKTRHGMLLALAAAVLAAGFCTIRFFPAAPRGHAAESNPRAAASTKPDAARVEPEAPAVVESTPPEVPAAAEETAASARPPVQSRVPAMRRANRPEWSTAIRVTGGESQPAAAMNTTCPDPPRPVEGPEAVIPKTNPAEAPEAGAPPATPELATPPEAAAPAKPQNAGNRFVRALGKVNPFRKRAKHDAGEASKTQLEKD
ncbi:MAG TPA: protein kinase [Bryobacteraceae bacterium]|nr:protein kinase [Bryobacteraceae bacterium]